MNAHPPEHPADRLTADRCRALLPKYAIDFHESVGSTSDAAAAWRGPLPAVVVADCQTAGRGTRGRTWLSDGGMTATFVFETSELPPHVLSLVAAVLVRRALAAFEPGVRIKPPNDLMLDGGKLCGLLCERKDGRDLIGVGRQRWLRPAGG